LEELAIPGVTVDARRDKRHAFAGVRLKGVWRSLIAKRQNLEMAFEGGARASLPKRFDIAALLESARQELASAHPE
jgi:hypothetical protein